MDWIALLLYFVAFCGLLLETSVILMTFRMKTMTIREGIILSLVSIGFIAAAALGYFTHKLSTTAFALPLLVIVFWRVFGAYLTRQIDFRLDPKVRDRYFP